MGYSMMYTWYIIQYTNTLPMISHAKSLENRVLMWYLKFNRNLWTKLCPYMGEIPKYDLFVPISVTQNGEISEFSRQFFSEIMHEF